jgi:hypothetical protein
MLASLAQLKAALNITDATDDADLTLLLQQAEAALGAVYHLPTVPAVTETRTLFVDGSLLHLAECSEVTAVTDLDDSPLTFITDPGRRPDDFLNGVILHDPYTGRVQVTGTWGYDATPQDVAGAIVETAATWYRRKTYGNEGNFIGRLDAIPQSARDLMGARR